jgi:hypothetical protein
MTDISVQRAGNTAYIGIIDENGLDKYSFLILNLSAICQKFHLFLSFSLRV